MPLKNLSWLILVAALTFVTNLRAQNRINGKVTDDVTQPISGATVILKGTTTGVVTDTDGSYTIIAEPGNKLVFSYLGFKTLEVTVGNQTTINITMVEDATQLQDVFVTATSKPIRKIEATTAVEAIGIKEIEKMNPVSLMDLVRFTPGINVQTQAGRVRNFIFTRGFPDASGNGLVYTSLLIDGVRTFASPEMVPDAAFRNDLNIGRIEVVRGNAATLYGRGSAAGAINIISRTGGKEHEGTLKFTAGQNNWFQFDANANGPLNKSKTWRYNIGGFWLSDDGFRDNLFPDRGGQLRANVDHIFPNNKGNLRIYGGVIGLNVQNLLSIPYAAADLTRPVGNWTTRDIELSPDNPFVGSGWPITNPNTGITQENPYDPSYGDGNFSRGRNIGLNLDYDLGNGFKVVNKTRLQKMTVGIAFDFSVSQNFGDFQQKFIFGGGGTDGGSDSKEFVQELRLLKSIESANAEHNFTVGGFYSDINILVESSGSLYLQGTADPDNLTYDRQPFGFPLNLNFRNGDYDESVTSGFVGYEGKFNDKLTFNVGGRYDAIRLDLTDNFRPGQENLNVVQEHDGFSWSVGANYLISDVTALYGNFSSSFRAPDFGTYTPVEFLPGTEIIDAPRVEENEEIKSLEVGFRTTAGDLNVDLGLFNTNINNRLVPGFEGAVAVQVPAGDNRITGAELSLIYTPSALAGLYLRSSITFQDTEYTEFLRESPNGPVDLAGNDLANVPPLIANFSVGFSNDKFGININNNFVSERPVDIYNTTDYPSRLLVDANISYNFSKKVGISLGGQNLTNVTHASSVISAVADDAFFNAAQNGFAGDFANVRGVPFLPRRIFGSVTYRF